MIARAAAALTLQVMLGAAPTDPPSPVIVVQPEIVTVADPFLVTITVRVPRGTTVVFPPAPDSTQVVEALDPAVTSEREDGGLIAHTARYRLAAWDVGNQTVRLADLSVEDAAGVRHLPLAPVVVVRSVLPADTAKRVPREARDIEAARPPRWPWVAGAAVLIAAATLAWRWRRRRRPPVVPSALGDAQRTLAAVEQLGLLEAGEPARYVALHAEALRAFLSSRLPGASRALTTNELAPVLGEHDLAVARILTLLGAVDEIQFARRKLTAVRAQELSREVRAVLAAVDADLADRLDAANPKRVA